MISLSKFPSRFAVNKPASFFNFNHYCLPTFRSISNESKDPSVTRIRNVKRYFAFGLFGITLVVALTIKQQRRRKWNDLLSKTSRTCTFGNLVLYELDHYMLPKPVLELLEKIAKFEFFVDDIVLTSFPKTGTTWISEIIWLLTNNLDYETARKVNIGDRFPYLEWPTPGLKSIANSRKRPRVIKTHLPISILLKNRNVRPRIISVTRDPKDVLVSYYHFARMNNVIGFAGGFAEFLEQFQQDKIAYGPIYRFYNDLAEAQRKTNQESLEIFVTRYEDLQNNFEDVVRKLCSFLGREPLSEKEMLKMKEHCSFTEMQVNPSVNYEHWDDLGVRKRGESKFMRKGIIGDWKFHFNQEQMERFDEWFALKTNTLKPIDEIEIKANLIN